MGPTGPAGRDGSGSGSGGDGATGPTGPTGLPGAVGPTGPRGAEGARGPAGEAGPIGPTGPGNGPTGPTGATGPIGATGGVGKPRPAWFESDVTAGSPVIATVNCVPGHFATGALFKRLSSTVSIREIDLTSDGTGLTFKVETDVPSGSASFAVGAICMPVA